MIVNSDRRGRTESGRFTWQPLVVQELDDFEYPPEARYWSDKACIYQNQLRRLLGEAYQAWAELVWPGATIKEYSWRDIALQSKAALEAVKAGERVLEQLCVIAWDALAKPADHGCYPYSQDSMKRGE